VLRPPDLVLGDPEVLGDLAVGRFEARAQIVERVHDDRERVPKLVRDAGRELADRRHLLRLHELRFEAALLRDVDADELDPVPAPVVDRTRAHVDGHQLGVGDEEVQVVAARAAARDRLVVERFAGGALGRRQEIGEAPADQLGARHPEHALGDRVRVDHAAFDGVGPQDARRRMVDRAPIAGFLVEQELLAPLDEEVGDVEDPDLDLLDEQRGEARVALGVVHVQAPELRVEELGEPHLGRDEAGRRELADEAVARMAAQEDVRLEVAWVGDVPRPAGRRRHLVVDDARPVRFGEGEGGADLAHPMRQDPGRALEHELGEFPTEPRGLVGYPL
jgi:hypothetical protein